MAEPLKIPENAKNPVNATSVDTPSDSLKIQVARDNANAKKEPPPFIPLQEGQDTFIEPAFTRLGTQANAQAYANIIDKSNPKGVILANKVRYALKDKEDYDKKLKSHSEITQLAASAPIPTMGMSPSKAPVLNPFTSFLTSFGKSDVEVISGIARSQLRAQHYADKYEAAGISKLIESDDSLISAPEALFEHMNNSGKFFATTEEQEFFKAGYGSKYASKYETSPFALLQKKYMAQYKGTMHPSQLKMMIDEGGFRLNPNNKDHQKMFDDYLAWQEKHPDMKPLVDRFFTNVGQTGKMLADSVVNTLYTSVTSVGDPEIAWNPDFKDEDAKKALTDKLLILASAKSNGEILKGYTEDSALKMVEKQFAATGQVDMDLFDEDAKNNLPDIIVEVAKQVKDLDEKGAFKKDVGFGVTPVLTTMSAMITGGIGLAMMGINSDPESYSMTAINHAAAAIDWVGLGFDRDRALGTFSDVYKKRQMEGMNTGASYATWHHHLASEGILGASVMDTRYHENASHFLTPFEGVALLSGGMKLGRGLAVSGARAAGVEKSFLERVGLQESLDVTLGKLNVLSKQGVPFAEGMVDAELKAVIEDVKAQGRIAGETVDDYEAIRRVYEGKGRVADRADPSKMVKAGEEILDRLSKHISTKAEQVGTMRDAIVEAARSGRKIEYSKETMESIRKAREALQKANPDVDYSMVPDTTIYDRVRRGALPLVEGKEVLTENQIRAMSADVGKVWRRVDMKDLAGFKRGQALPVQVSYLWGKNPLVNFASGTVQTGSRFADWLDELEKTFGNPRAGMNALGKISNSPGVSATTLQNQGNGMFRYAMANAVVPALRWLGNAGHAADFLQEFEIMNQRELGHDFNSTLLGMRNSYHAEMRKLLVRRASVRGGEWKDIKERLVQLGETNVLTEPQSIASSVNADKEVALIDDKLMKLEMKSKWAKNLHAFGANGALAGSVKLFKDGMVSSASNEFLIGLTDNFAGIGGGTAYAGFGSSVNAISSGWTAHFSRSNTIRERTNFDFHELRGRLDSFGQDPAGDVQRMKLLKTMMKAEENAKTVTKERGVAAGEAHYAREIATIANLFRTGAEIHITNAEVRQGLVTLMEGLQFQDPDFASEMKQHYLDTATKMGMSGDAATLYAKKMLDSVMESNAATVRTGTIGKEREVLEARKQRLIESTGVELKALEDGATILAKEAGLDVEKMFAAGFETKVVGKEDVNTDLYGIPHKGKPVPAPFGGAETPMPEIIGGVDISGMSPKVKETLKAFRTEFKRIKNLQVENEVQIRDINEQLTSLSDEALQLGKVKKVATYRDGQTITNPVDGATFTSYKNGITVWERDGKTSIFVDENKFSVADGREEIAHAIFFTENMKDSRAQLRNIILGEQTIDENGVRQVKSKPLIAETTEKSLELMDKFVSAHAESLSESDAVWFKATWNRGKKNFERNPDDTRLMQSVFVELAGRLYQARLELANPHMVRSGQQGSTDVGSVEMSNIPIRQKQITGEERETALKKMTSGARLFSKLIVGDLRVEDILNEGRPINATDIDLDGKHTTAKFGDGSVVRDAAKFIQAFGVGGVLDGMWNAISVERLEGMGFVRSGNNSPDYSKFWQHGKIRHPVSNELLDIDPALMGWAEQMIAHTRNRGSAPDVDALSDLESVFNEREDTSEGAKRRRLMWALASGRRKFINPETGMFQKSLASMMQAEWQPIGSLIQRIITPRIGEDGDWSGMKVKKTVDGRTVLIGAPNAAQTRRIIDHIKENYGQHSEGNEIVMKNIAIFLEAMADGNRFDPKARSVENGGAPGWTQVFIAEYSGVWQGKGVGTTGKTKVGGTNPQQRMLVPLRCIIRDSNLDVVGKKKTADEDTGEMPGMPEMYFEMYDPVAANTAKLNAWNGNLFMEGGSRYWTQTQIRNLFDNSKPKLEKAMDLVLENYQNGGSISRKSTERPPEESWEVLLDLADGNPFDAKKMASMVNRIHGFQQTDFMELNGLEQELIKKKGKLSGKKEARLEDLREKFSEENDSEDGPTPLEKITESERRMAVFYGERPNLYGTRPMRDTQSPISLFRADRFTGEAVAHVADNGTPHKVRWNQFTQGWGNANYASQNWISMTKESLTSAGTGFNTGHREIVEGMYHKSGYTLFKMQDPQPADPNKKPNSEYFLLDPTRKLVGRGYRNKDTALDAAEEHAQGSNLPPEAGNAIEIELGNQGWKPKGINFAGRIRSTFVSADGNWKAERNVVRGSSGYDLIDIKSGIVVAEGIKLGLKADRKTPMVDDLNAAVQAANEGGTVRLKMTEAFENKIKETSGLADWTIVHQDGKKNKVFFASGNPAYYDIRRRLATTLGWKKVNEVTKQMRQELGDDVVSTDWKKTVDWFEGWTHNWHSDQIRQMAEQASAGARAELADINRTERELYNLREGEQLVWKQPTEPKKPGPNANKSQIDKFNEAMARFTEESIAWSKHQKGLEELPINEQEVDLLLDWTKRLKTRGDEFTRRATLGGQLSEGGVAAQRSQGPIDQLTIARNAMAEARIAGESIWYVDNAGYIIQQLMYKAERPPFGVEITHNKLLVLGDKKSEVKRANYILYAPGGQIMLRAKSREEAVEAAYKQKEPQWLKNFIQQGGGELNLGEKPTGYNNIESTGPYRGPTNKNSTPSRVPATNRYNKPAPR